MKNIIVSTFFIFLAGVAFSQEQFSYSFKGTADSSTLVSIAKEMETFKGITSVKIRYKEAKGAGEFMIFSAKGTKKDPYPFQPVEVKKMLINKGFEPLEFRKIK